MVIYILAIALLSLGLMVNPLDGVEKLLERVGLKDLPRDPVAVDAIPDLGENQQILFTRWSGRSPRDIEDQISYPLTTQLLGLPGVQSVRSNSMFGFSSIYVIFNENIEFYWARSRILEKLSALPEGTLPEGVAPVLGPDATALGQIYWYTLEGRDPETDEVLGGWDLHELRTIQDWTLRYALQSVAGVAEVASIGGYVTEYQIDVDPDKLSAYGLSLTALAKAVREANRDVGARSLEINKTEYILRGVGQLEGINDLESVVVAERAGRPLRVSDLARVHLGPAGRRGALDVGGAEAVGAVVVARYGENPVEVIKAIKAKIAELQPSLPSRTLSDGRVSQLKIQPFYDRSQVVTETLGTLSEALAQQILITVIVILVLLGDLRSAGVISSILPLAVLGSFALMKASGVTANVMSLAGIAIAIGTMVDMGIVLTESLYERLHSAPPGGRRAAIIAGAAEVAPAIATSTATTLLSFLPVFGLTAAEGKLFHPLAFTKSYALLAALGISLLFLPTLAFLLLRGAEARRRVKLSDLLLFATAAASVWYELWVWATLIAVVSLARIFPRHPRLTKGIELLVIGAVLLYWLTQAWMPLGLGAGMFESFAFVGLASLSLLGIFWLFLQGYPYLLRWALAHKLLFSTLPLGLLIFGFTAWRGFDEIFGWLPKELRARPKIAQLAEALPGFESEFMPAFDEGQFLYMPTVMPHASIGQALDQLKRMDAAIQAIPEVEEAVGKLGRVESPLDPAPISMFETVVTYKPEWRERAGGKRVRQWRPHIKNSDDIWTEILKVTKQPGLTSAPKLMPINTRIVMLQSGMRAPIGIKLRGPDLVSLERAGLELERYLKQAPSVRAETVFAERVVGKPYLEIHLKRETIARYGLSVEDVQRVISLALGGVVLTTAIKGRERIDVRVRYERAARLSPEALERLIVTTSSGAQIPLRQLAELLYVKGPQAIKSEDTFLTSYVIFDKVEGISETEAVERVRARLEVAQQRGALKLPEGVSYSFAGSYQNQQRSAARLKTLIPIALLSIFLVLYLQFRAPSVSLIIYSGVLVAVSGGFLLIWLYQRPEFLNITPFGWDLRALFQIGPINLSVAVWVGFIALVGIATDDGVVMASYLQAQLKKAPKSVEGIRAATLEAGIRRVRPCLMTTATTILALLPVLTSTGRGADVMLPMAVPVVGGMAVELITLFVVPLLYSAREEARLWPIFQRR